MRVTICHGKPIEIEPGTGQALGGREGAGCWGKARTDKILTIKSCRYISEHWIDNDMFLEGLISFKSLFDTFKYGNRTWKCHGRRKNMIYVSLFSAQQLPIALVCYNFHESTRTAVACAVQTL